ncbi:specifically androgen-regulated gene protein isoform X1 [Vulpes vulpes]|uniref:Specifically androgen-regulated gene protein isoform X1 n=2 Tax=Vulpes vulpes TaxID=9627 RepID=A0ABM4YGT7_VULVU
MGARGPSAPHPCPRPGLRFQAATPAQFAQFAEKPPGKGDSSYDFLSAEEKECLLFLEETIGSLDTEADSGLSTDESEQDAAPRAPRVPPAAQPAPQGHPAERSAPRGPEPRRGPPAGPPRLPEPQGLGPRSGSYSLPRNIRIGSGQDLGRSSRPTSGPGEPEHLPEGPGAEAQAGGASRDSHPGPRALSPPATKAMWQEPQEGGPAPPPTPGSQAARAHDAASPAGVDPSARLAPLPAPKPRKLPPNIVLKSSRSGLHGEPQNWLSRHPDGGPGDSGPAATSLQEQRRARREALEKLGLPQDQDQPGPHFSGRTGCPGPWPRPGPQASAPAGAAPGPAPTRAPTLTSAPTSAPAPAPTPVPTSALTSAPAPTPAPTSALTSAPTPAPTPAPAQAPAQASPPLPAAKSRPIPIPKAPAAGGPLTQRRPDPALTLQESSIPGLRQMSFKSNTLERSGVGLGSRLPAEKDPSPQTSSSLGRDSFLGKVSPNVLRNTRPRPASLGTGKDFAGVRVAELAELQQPSASKRSSFQGQGRDRLPRPPCVSVKISPKGVPDEHRREALKKLGLLKE